MRCHGLRRMEAWIPATTQMRNLQTPASRSWSRRASCPRAPLHACGPSRLGTTPTIGNPCSRDSSVATLQLSQRARCSRSREPRGKIFDSSWTASNQKEMASAWLTRISRSISNRSTKNKRGKRCGRSLPRRSVHQAQTRAARWDVPSTSGKLSTGKCWRGIMSTTTCRHGIRGQPSPSNLRSSTTARSISL